MVQDISTTIGEQSKASTEVAMRVEQITQIAHRNQLAIADLAAASEQMETVVNTMQDTIARFRL